MNRLIRLCRKELREILRDRRALLTLVGLPILLYPLLGIAFVMYFQHGGTDLGVREYRIGVSTNEELNLLQQTLAAGQVAYGKIASRTLALTIGLPEPKLFVGVITDPAAMLRRGEIDVWVRLQARPAGLDCTLVYLNDGAWASREAREFVERRLIAANVVSNPHVRFSHETLSGSARSWAATLGALVPMILVLMTLTGAIYPAIDVTAGERERGTMELLSAAPISPVLLLASKFVAVWIVAMLTALTNLAAMTLTLIVSGLALVLFGTSGVSLWVIFPILGLLVLLSFLFSGLALAVAGSAQSFKEAQAYLVPIMLVCLIPTVLGLLPGMKLDLITSIIPLLNVVLLTRDLFEGTATGTAAAVVVIATFVHAGLAVIGAARWAVRTWS